MILSLSDLDGWQEPLPLGWHVKAPSFPVTVFPAAVERHVAALAEATQTPRDLPGTVSLGIIAAAIGGRLDVQCPTWTEPTNLFAVPVLPPASRKSAVVAACRAPLVDAERQLRDELGDQVHDTQTEWEILHKRAESAKAKAAKTGEPDDLADAQESVRAAEEARTRIVAWPRLSTADATPEALVGLLAEQGGRIAALSAEAGVFASLTGRYAKSPNLDPVLMAHAGDTITVDRRSRAPEHVDHPALTIVASIQPFALREMVDRDDFAGRGLLARVLWSVPADNAGYRKVRDVAPVPDAVAAEYRTLIVDLAVWAGKRRDRLVLKLDDQATDELLTYAERVEKLLRPNGQLGEYRLTREWGGKLVGAVARIAGCLHAARGVDYLDEPISGETMRCAIALGDYYRAHALLALTPGDDKQAEAARTLLGWLVNKGRGTFTVRELCRSAPRAMRKADVLDRILTYLAELGWVRRTADATGYELHPDAGRHLHRGDSGDSGDSEEETAGQAPDGPPAPPVATRGDNRRQAATPPGDVSPPVATRGDTTGDTTLTALNSEDAAPVAAVAAVAAPTTEPATPHAWWVRGNRPEHVGCLPCRAMRPGDAV
ncbi:YfjI family protein [Micromonospora sp. DT62]|uniref:YfjI family protein n=1 Tax=Micromonospora sp. DT62 TaxID=3416521 RepID=UPI003CF3ACCE